MGFGVNLFHGGAICRRRRPRCGCCRGLGDRSLADLTWDLVEGVEAELRHLGDAAYAVDELPERVHPSAGRADRLPLRRHGDRGRLRGFDEIGRLLLDGARGAARGGWPGAGEVIEGWRRGGTQGESGRPAATCWSWWTSATPTPSSASTNRRPVRGGHLASRRRRPRLGGGDGDPATGEVVATVADADTDDALAAVGGRRGGRPRLGGDPAAPRARGAAPGVHRDAGARRGARRADLPRERQVAGRRPRRGGVRGGVLPLVRRGGGAAARQVGHAPSGAQPA